MKEIISKDLFFLTGKTYSFGSAMFLNAVQMMTKYRDFFFKTVFLFIGFGSSFPTFFFSFTKYFSAYNSYSCQLY